MRVSISKYAFLWYATVLAHLCLKKIKTNIISKIFSPFLILVLLLYQRSFRLYWLIFSLWVRVEQERSVIFSSIFLCENLCQIISIKRLCFVRLSFIFLNKNKYKNNNTFFQVSDNESHKWKNKQMKLYYSTKKQKLSFI